MGQFLLYVHLFLGCLVLCLLFVQCHSCFVGPSRSHRRRKNHTVAVAKITALQGAHVLLPVLASPPVLPACRTQNARAARMARMLAVARAASADAARRSRARLTERRLWEWNFLSRKLTWASIPGYMKLFGFLLLLLHANGPAHLHACPDACAIFVQHMFRPTSPDALYVLTAMDKKDRFMYVDGLLHVL